MDINDLKSQPKTCVQKELIDQSNEQENQIIQSLPKFQIQNYNIDQEQDIELKNIKVGKKFQYKLLKSHKQNIHCSALVYNKKGNFLFVACKQSILVYFNCYTSKKLQKLPHHSNYVDSLYFMKKSNSFVSESEDNSIIIWELDKLKQWSIKTQLKEHKDWVLCVLMNQNEDLLISGSCDNTVKFWGKFDYKWSCQQTIDLKDYCFNLSLNEQEEKLIACGHKPFIYVMQIKQDKTWSIFQIIEVAEQGLDYVSQTTIN